VKAMYLATDHMYMRTQTKEHFDVQIQVRSQEPSASALKLMLFKSGPIY